MSGDERVKYAIDALRYFDGGTWVTGGLTVQMAGHLADAIRGLLAVIDEDEARAGQLAEIGAVIAGFDWETDDRQYALEEIERIVTGSEQ